MSIILWRRPLLGLSLLFLTGCESYTSETRQMRQAFVARDYPKALEALEKSPIATQERSRLLYLLEKASIYDRMGERKKARQLLIDADALAYRLYTVSISKTAATYVYNESASDYAGEDYEKVAIHTSLAISFLGEGDIQGARVEARKINNVLNEINMKHEDKKNRYTQDAFARYLSGAIFESKKEYDSAIIDYRAALKEYESTYSDLFYVEPPRQLVAALYRLSRFRGRGPIAKDLEKRYSKVTNGLPRYDRLKEGELLVVHELGRISSKVQKEFMFVWSGKVQRISFPYIRTESAPDVQGTGVKISGQGAGATELVQNMNAIARKTLEDRRERLIAKAAARLIVKDQIAQQAKEHGGLPGQILANIYGAATETADTRSWTLLPAGYAVTRVLLPPGNYDVEVSTSGQVMDVRKVTVKAGTITMIRDRPDHAGTSELSGSSS